MKGGQTLRIIGGEWRGRRLPFPNVKGLRPTADRVRETVFNWLQVQIPGARCLDLFAGSGAMGFEAASRGAKYVQLVDRSPKVYASLKANRELLDAGMIDIVCQDGLAFLKRGTDEPFDVVLLDPPFDSAIIEPCCQLLEANGWLAPEARIYLELDKSQPMPELPANWELVRERQAGRVAFRLAIRQAPKQGDE
ncbi:16S rRNA (guanine(966)-N(2))-methyltransferase RsmD [Alkalilimnicola ehrlichii]|uniref:Ribosomal RNA small subunit methyltransferase D n=1 Tax=Alkalilimnicola ehrlichii TaxID=351052 RepID=A0A3E0WX64_9GAMM|nr:16S rRNA (guanine(966)-N(2))-methyltransferase RsmD [Alkalilimnicola ehrlichii]RFA30057.1 16S rRNA (guanine(966)-N(2))-methyltransferase RsmD [Alkalilimnicola ehrlichii]RFA37398.1 16S rRNA (guanine(966)-N(2))-methyltransferase RsmD [Alkalilimnicola ehrlichii]